MNNTLDPLIDDLREAAQRVAEARAPADELVDPIARYLAALPVPARYDGLGSMGRTSFSRRNRNRDGTSLFIHETALDIDLEALADQDVGPADYDDYADEQHATADLDSSRRLDRPDVAADGIVEMIDYARDETEDIDRPHPADLAAPAFPCVAFLDHHDAATVRARGPGDDGRVYYGADLADADGMAVWIPDGAHMDGANPASAVALSGLPDRETETVVDEVTY